MKKWGWLCWCGIVFCARADEGFRFDELTRVDVVECATDTTHDFMEYPEGISSVETILGQSVRSLPNVDGEMKYFAYRLGAGLGLEADRGYILRVVYPQDQPRSMFILNRGCETARGFHTGRTTGDGLVVPYVNNNCESLELPLSGAMESWEMLFYLQERFPDLKQPRGTEFPRDQTPADGFLVLCLQLSAANDPLSAGVAIERLELYEAPPLDELTQPLAELPPGLPQRHLFWREEMADGVIGSSDLSERGYADDLTWYEQKFRLMQFLGMKTFAKDLLEFGANQGWDSSKYGGNTWVYQSKFTRRWSRIVRRCGELGFSLLPYYEYTGSKGSSGYGYERRAEPLYGAGDYTHISWSEVANVDVTDPDTFEDFRKMLEITVVDEQESGSFAGIWMRQRVSDLPISFAAACRARFEEESGEVGVTRARLEAEEPLYDAYVAWWYGKRKRFLEQLRDYLRTNVHSEMDLLFTADSSEAGKARLSAHASDVIAEDPAVWASEPDVSVNSLAEALVGHWQLQTLTNDWATWGSYEWQHSVPHADPARYVESEGLFMTETVNRAYTLEPEALAAFRAQDGLATIRHYSLNEDATLVGDDRSLVGYFVADMDYAGAYVMMPEALAFAHGDPTYFGYLASNNFNRGDPWYVRRFNANFMALPALPSVVDERFSADSELVVRRIDTPSNGTYLGAVNLGRTRHVHRLLLPEEGLLLDAISGAAVAVSNQVVALEMDPYELRSFRFFPAASNTPPEILLNNVVELEWFNALTTHGGWLITELSPIITEYDAGDQIESIEWSVLSGATNAVQIQQPAAGTTKVAFAAPGTYQLNLRVSDGADVRNQAVQVRISTRRAQIALSPEMADYSGTNIEDSGLFNNQDAGDPPYMDVGGSWTTTGASMYPVDFMVDLGQVYQLCELWLFDYNGVGTFRVYTGSETNGWNLAVDCETDSYKVWKSFEVEAKTRYLKIERVDGNANVGELILFGQGDGFERTARFSPLPATPELTVPSGSHTLQLRFHTHPFVDRSLYYSENMTNWTVLGTWSGLEPFVEFSRPQAQRGFFRLKDVE